jgi:hypothetical protein
MTITEEEAIGRIMLGLGDGSLRLVETTRKKDGNKAFILCITAPLGKPSLTEPFEMKRQIRPIAELTLIRDAAEAGNYNRPTTLEMNPAWKDKYGKPIGE